jgi:hypothetical protein
MKNFNSPILMSLLMLMVPVNNIEASKPPAKVSATTPSKKASGKNSAAASKSSSKKERNQSGPKGEDHDILNKIDPDKYFAEEEALKKIDKQVKKDKAQYEQTEQTYKQLGKIPTPKIPAAVPKAKDEEAQTPSKKPQSKKLSRALGIHLVAKLEELLDHAEFSQMSDPEDIANEEDDFDHVEHSGEEVLSRKQRQLLLIQQIIDENIKSDASTDEETLTTKKVPAAVARTPSSDQRKLIVRHRTSLEKSGSIPDNLSEQLDPLIMRIPHAAFAPTILPCLLKLISEEQECILGACYELDEGTFAKAWANQCDNKGIKGELVLNYRTLLDKVKDDKSSMRPALRLLQKKILLFQNTQRYKMKNVKVNGAWVNYDTTNGTFGQDTLKGGKPNRYKEVKFFENMHHKFFLFRRNELHGQLVVTGSFNWTSTANDDGWENIVILNDRHVIDQFLEEWDQLCQYREQFTINNQGLLQLAPVAN